MACHKLSSNLNMINQTMLYNDFYLKSKVFLDKLHLSLSSSHFKIMPHWNIDHICYRADTPERYCQLKNSFSKFATEIIESEINGRPITTYKLNTPLKYSQWSINLLELPAPKASKVTEEGFEHIEIVSNKDFTELSQELQEFPLNKNGLKKEFNRELACTINGTNLKFHHTSLESVVTLEANSRVFNAITESNILTTLNRYHPLIVGAYPLGLYTENSNIEILLSGENLPDLISNVKKYCDKFDQFKINFGDNNSSVRINFIFSGFQFELYSEKSHSLQQQGCKHFQIGERLLKIGSPQFKKNVIQSRDQGLSVEASFKKALSLNEDISLKLMQLYEYSEEKLIDSLPNLSTS